MTVCIAALCESDGVRYVVFAADRMITAGDIEYEPDTPKVYRLSANIAALVAGDTAAQSVIGQATQLEIERRSISDVQSAADIFAEHVVKYRRKISERRILAPYGLTFDTFLKASNDMSGSLVAQIRDELDYFDSGIEAIVAGAESNGWTHIYQIDDHGVPICQDITGFAAIGKGARHAETEFMSHRYTPTHDASEALLLAYTAKRKSEAAPGVGQSTDVGILAWGTDLVMLNPLLEERLKAIYDGSLEAVDQVWEDQKAEVQAFIAERAAEQNQSETEQQGASTPPSADTP